MKTVTRGSTRLRCLIRNLVPQEELNQLHIDELTISQLQALVKEIRTPGTRKKEMVNALLGRYTTRLQYGMTAHIETKLNNKDCDTKYHASELIKLRSVALRVKSSRQLVEQLHTATNNIDNMEPVTIDNRYVVHRGLIDNMRRLTQAVMALMDHTTFMRLMTLLK